MVVVSVASILTLVREIRRNVPYELTDVKSAPKETRALPHDLEDLEKILDEFYLANSDEKFDITYEASAANHLVTLQAALSRFSDFQYDLEKSGDRSIAKFWIETPDKIRELVDQIRYSRESLPILLKKKKSSLLQKANVGSSLIVTSSQSLAQHRDLVSYASSSDFQKRHVDSSCKCGCHRRRCLFPFPPFLRSLVGRMNISWKGIGGAFCNLPLCREPQSASAEILYHLPTWLGSRVFYVEYIHGTLSVRVHGNMVLGDSKSFQCCSVGDLDGLRELLNGGEASILDVDADYETLLHKALRNDRVEIVRFLKGAGASLNTPNLQHITPVDLALDRIFTNPSDEMSMTLLGLFEFDLYERHVTDLHLIVSGLRSVDLESYLEISTTSIDALDFNSKTPLYWAVRGGNIKATKILLDGGASVSVGSNPMAWSCREMYDRPDCMQLLLRHGTDPNGTDSDGYTALHACGIYGRTESFILDLVRSGANLELPYWGVDGDFHGITALGFACLYSQEESLRILLENGSGCNHQDSRGRSPLHLVLAQHWKRKGRSRPALIVRLLITAGAVIDLRDNDGISPAKLATLKGDVESLSLLMNNGASIGPEISKEWLAGGRSTYKVDREPTTAQRSSGSRAPHIIEREDANQDDGIARKNWLNKNGRRSRKKRFDNVVPSYAVAENSSIWGWTALVLLNFLSMFVIMGRYMEEIGSKLKILFRRKIPVGHSRITWTCDCGTELYGDFETKHPNNLAELADALNGSLNTHSGSPRADIEVALPPAAHVRGENTSRQLHGAGGRFQQPITSLSMEIRADATDTPSQTNFLHLCINTGDSCQTLGEINTSFTSCDMDLFQQIQKRYREIRGFRIKKHFLLKPVSIKFVLFGLEERHKIHIFEEPSFPPEEEVTAQRYHYLPCPPRWTPPPMPSNAFIHYLSKCILPSAELGKKKSWLDRLPKKLQQSITRSDEDLVMAWGIHIIEGPDMVRILWTMICVLSVCLGPIVAYVVLKKDVQGATGMGGLAVSVLAYLLIAVKYYEWKDG